MKRLAILAVMIAACSDTTPTTTDLLNINRPIDMSFACYGGMRVTNGTLPATADEPVIVSAQPTFGCDIRSQPHALGTPVPVAPGQEAIPNAAIVPDAQWVGFVLQSEPGTVAIATWNTKPSTAFSGGDVSVVDANLLVPGQNGISVGEKPVAIGTDTIGCKEVIANAGSCDMSVLDINSAMAGGQNAIVDRLAVTDAAGNKVRSKPAAMQMQPPAGVMGVQCGPTATGIAWVAYPSCHAVAAIDTATGKVQRAIKFDAAGVATVDPTGNLSCPDECSGAAVMPGTRPVALSLLNDTRVGRSILAIGADNSNLVPVVALAPASALPSLAPRQIALQQTAKNDLGITSLTVSPQIGMGGSTGVINDDASIGGQGQYVYAVATDNTVRVADILTINKECDTQADPRYLTMLTDVKFLSCMPVGDSRTPPRRPLARGPGIELLGDAIPTSVAITKVDPVDGTLLLPGDPKRLIGYFAFITAANGATYIANVDNDDFADVVDPQNPIGTPIPLDIAHQLRDSVPFRSLLATTTDANQKVTPICDTNGPDPDATTGNEGGPRSTDYPGRVLPTGTVANEKVLALPSIRQVKCVGSDEPNGKPVAETQFAAPVDVRLATFPDLRGLRGDEVWTLSWEGSLSQDTGNNHIDGPAIRESQMFVDGFGPHLIDQGKPYCDAGVEPYDIVQLRGCDPSLGDADCALGYTCFVHPQSKVAGIGACMLKQEADRLANACKPFLTSLRRYTVSKSTSGQLDLLPRKHVLHTSPVDGCTDDTQCQTLANYALQLASSANPVDDHTAPDSHHYACQLDPTRAPVAGTGKLCIQTCSTDTDCDDGTVCDNGTCMESVTPPQACVNAGQRYELRAHDAFTVVGSKSGYVHSIIADPNGTCVKDPNASPFQVGRIPLIAPACDPTADPQTGKLPGGGYQPNPCEETTDETELEANYNNLAGGVCTIGTPASNLVTVARDSILFRNRGMQLEIVDPTYPGDKVCIGDRGANLGRIPVVTAGFQINFRQTAGFNPLLVAITPSLPIKAVTGPTESVWVIDEGDFLSTSIATPSTRGKVFRFEGQSITTINLLE
ncbi:MAG: hypothetical protein JO257_33655 [Deltaproteobacteria bacterium]|nr:hypothetical protein [Deltaproteobacteria bacterium]